MISIATPWRAARSAAAATALTAATCQVAAAADFQQRLPATCAAGLCQVHFDPVPAAKTLRTGMASCDLYVRAAIGEPAALSFARISLFNANQQRSLIEYLPLQLVANQTDPNTLMEVRDYQANAPIQIIARAGERLKAEIGLPAANYGGLYCSLSGTLLP
jgi:hypothetical protein